MATASVSNLPVCSICRESFTKPKVLPCGHTFCLRCLKRIVVANIDTFPCPYCKQDVEIPEDGAQGIATNFIVEEIMVFLNNEGRTPASSGQPSSTPQSKCPRHKQDELNRYCEDCSVGLCPKCTNHTEHKTLDIESDATRSKAIENLQRSQTIIENRIKYLKKNRSTLLESFEQVKSLCEDSCTKVDEHREQIVSDLEKHCEKIKQDIRKSLDENRSKVEDRRNEITGDIDLLEREIESNISPSTKTTLNILQTSPCLINIESREDYNLCIQYLQWVGKDFSIDIDQLGSVISKSFNRPGLYQFLFRVVDITKELSSFPAIYRFRINDMRFRCNVVEHDGDLFIGITLLKNDNPKLDYCIIDGQISLLNIDDNSKTISTSCKYRKLETGEAWSFYPITQSKFYDKNNGYLTSKNKFVIQFDITQIREISWK